VNSQQGGIVVNKMIRWVAPVAVACTVMAFGLEGAQASRHVASSPVKASAGVSPSFSPLKGKLQTTRLANGQSGASAPGGFTAVDAPQTIPCPATKAPCTINAVMSVQVDSGGFGQAPGPWAICLLVDSTFNTCPFLDDGANNGGFTAATMNGTVGGLGGGSHTVQTFVYTSTATTVQIYDIAYHEYV
jgi:hypothetical protein